MAEAILLKTEEQYDRAITSLGMEGSPALASALDDLILLLREAIQDQYMEAQTAYEEMYGWSTDPEKTFDEWLDYEFPELADIPKWVFARKVEEDGP